MGLKGERQMGDLLSLNILISVKLYDEHALPGIHMTII